MPDTSTFRRTLRAMATAADPTERLRLSDLLASEIEVALNNQGNRNQVALWDVQESAYQKIDDLHRHQADTNMLLSKVIESMGEMQSGLARVLTVQGENAARLGKIEDQVYEIDARHGAQWEEAMALLRESQAHRARLQRAVDALESQMLPPGERDRLIAEHHELKTKIAGIEARLARLEERDRASSEP